MSMGLVRLLKVGRTFGAATDRPRRYQALPGGGLPKLRPVTRATRNETTMKQTVKPVPAESRPMKPIPPAKPEELRPRPAAPKSGARSWTEGAVSWWREAGRLLFEAWGGNKNRAARIAPSGPRGPVQQELALENVKPCRNDLSDAGWEMIPPLTSRPKRSLFQKLAGRRESPFAARVQPAAPVAARPE